MTLGQGIALFVAGYLALLARSAWKQNEFPHFLRSLLIVALLLLTLGIITIAYTRLIG